MVLNRQYNDNLKSFYHFLFKNCPNLEKLIITSTHHFKIKFNKKESLFRNILSQYKFKKLKYVKINMMWITSQIPQLLENELVILDYLPINTLHLCPRY